jgi:hypothetical protein
MTMAEAFVVGRRASLVTRAKAPFGLASRELQVTGWAGLDDWASSRGFGRQSAAAHSTARKIHFPVRAITLKDSFLIDPLDRKTISYVHIVQGKVPCRRGVGAG